LIIYTAMKNSPGFLPGLYIESGFFQFVYRSGIFAGTSYQKDPAGYNSNPLRQLIVSLHLSLAHLQVSVGQLGEAKVGNVGHRCIVG